MMTFLFIVACIAFAAVTIPLTVLEITWRVNSGAGFLSTGRKLSSASDVILTKYHKLPKDSQAGGNMAMVLRRLDERYGKDKVTEHFEQRFTEAFSWSCRCGIKCQYQEYKDLFAEVKAVAHEVRRKDNIIKELGTRDAVDSAQNMLDSLRSERIVLRQTNAEISN